MHLKGFFIFVVFYKILIFSILYCFSVAFMFINILNVEKNDLEGRFLLHQKFFYFSKPFKLE